MKLQGTISRSSDDSSRCRHASASGQRCRLPVLNEDSQFCTRHAKLPQNQADPDDSPDSSASLTAGLAEFTSAEPVNEFLSRLLLLLGQNRISPRRAAVLAYIANQILRTIAAMDSEDERGLSSPMDRLKAHLERTPATPQVVEYLAAELARAERESAETAENNSLHSVGSREYRST
jgi:hypothetical protein